MGRKKLDNFSIAVGALVVIGVLSLGYVALRVVWWLWNNL
jgi:hypothetical protein